MNIHNEGHYLPRLLEVFSQCEDIDDREALSHLYSIIKFLIMMNDMQLVEQMVSDQFFWGVVGALEYDPDLTPKKAEHRSFLKVRSPSFPPCVTVPTSVLCDARGLVMGPFLHVLCASIEHMALSTLAPGTEHTACGPDLVKLSVYEA